MRQDDYMNLWKKEAKLKINIFNKKENAYDSEWLARNNVAHTQKYAYFFQLHLPNE